MNVIMARLVFKVVNTDAAFRVIHVTANSLKVHVMYIMRMDLVRDPREGLVFLL